MSHKPGDKFRLASVLLKPTGYQITCDEQVYTFDRYYITPNIHPEPLFCEKLDRLIDTSKMGKLIPAEGGNGLYHFYYEVGKYQGMELRQEIALLLREKVLKYLSTLEKGVEDTKAILSQLSSSNPASVFMMNAP